MEKEKLFEQLPENIVEATEMSDNAKKVLGALLYWLFNTKAYETGIIAINNGQLRAISGIKQNYMFDAIAELKSFNLVERKVGTERGCASEYTINCNNIKKPLKKNSFEYKFSKFFDDDESSETPLGTTYHNISLHNNTIHNISLQNNSIQNNSFQENNLLKKDYMKEEKDYIDYNEILDRIYQKEEENLKKEEKPSIPTNYKELQDLFIEKLKNSCEDEKTFQELEEIGIALHNELDENFNHIPNYKNIHYSINHTIEAKQSKVLPVTIIDYQKF